jgi:hypothetical protein
MKFQCIATVTINSAAFLDVQLCLMEIVNVVEECVESKFLLNSTLEMDVVSASKSRIYP